MRFVSFPLSIILLLCTLGQFSFASELPSKVNNSASINPSVKARLASKSLLLDITKVGQDKLVAVGERGHIILSSDAVNWQQADVPLQTTLTSVFFLNDYLGWAVGHDATILNSTDGGLTWQIQQHIPALEKPLFDIVFKSPTEGLAIGAYGQTFRTNDGGKTWQNEFHSEILLPDDAQYLAELKQEDEDAYLDEASFILPHFNRLALDGRTLYMVGEIGLIAKSNDFGKNWITFDSIYQGSFFDISRTHQGNLLIAGLRGHVFRSLNNGKPWEPRETNAIALINDIVLSDDERIFLLANNGVLLESLDDGQTYRLRMQKDGKALIAGVWFKQQLVTVSDVGIKIISL
ncbi:WD40/YVTN/BNR-like repeat-containing protein [Colwellia sp. E150_009]